METLCIVDERLGLTGNDLVFEKESFFGLVPGEFIIQVGNGKENGCIRTDRFLYPVQYVGSIYCQFSEKEKMFAFMLPEKEGNECVYLIYGSTGSEIFTEGVYSMKDRTTGKTTGYMRFYAPEFIRTQSK